MIFDQKLLLKRPSRDVLLRVFVAAALGLLAIGATLTALRLAATDHREGEVDARMSLGKASDSRLNLPPHDLLRPISAQEAVKENAKRGFSSRPDSPATAFVLAPTAATYERALECMTQAVYYEAASEGIEGGRAVAQVILNRMRHPAYPNSVCGVVYSGSERLTGCQFTFTCDGSMARAPVPSLWSRARSIAAKALGGEVYEPVGHATHYHADYVLPYWADSLDKSIKVGRHIFYRLKGGLGASRSFNQRYAGSESLPVLMTTAQTAAEAAQQAVSPIGVPIIEDPITSPKGVLIAPDSVIEVAADEAVGKLLIDGDTIDGPSSSRSGRRPAQECREVVAAKQLRPMTRNDVRAHTGSSDCS